MKNTQAEPGKSSTDEPSASTPGTQADSKPGKLKRILAKFLPKKKAPKKKDSPNIYPLF